MNTERKPGYYRVMFHAGMVPAILYFSSLRQWRGVSGLNYLEADDFIVTDETPISPEPQGMTREELIEKAKHALFNYNYDCDNDRAVDIAVYMVDFALSLSPAVTTKVTDEEITKEQVLNVIGWLRRHDRFDDEQHKAYGAMEWLSLASQIEIELNQEKGK